MPKPFIRAQSTHGPCTGLRKQAAHLTAAPSQGVRALQGSDIVVSSSRKPGQLMASPKGLIHLVLPALLSLGLAGAEAAPRYRLTNIAGEDVAYRITASDISENGLVTGYLSATPYDDEQVQGRAYIYEAGSLRILPSLGGFAEGSGINSSGQVAMSSSPSWYYIEAQPAWYNGRETTGFGASGGAHAINERGHVAG
ncbi:MAG TPA: hypothetical protein VEB23_04465, partial [Ramlibacter sp.]|nr:hypothetical protein [Ramlibacter sp.]